MYEPGKALTRVIHPTLRVRCRSPAEAHHEPIHIETEAEQTSAEWDVSALGGGQVEHYQLLLAMREWHEMTAFSEAKSKVAEWNEQASVCN